MRGNPPRLPSQRTYSITSQTFGKSRLSKPSETRSNRVVSSDYTISSTRLIFRTAPRRSNRGLRQENPQRSPKRKFTITSARNSAHTTSCSNRCYRKQDSKFSIQRIKKDSTQHTPASGREIERNSIQFAH